MIFLSMIACANLGVVLHPGVWSICISRMVNVVIGGFMMIVANAVIADLFAGRGEMMGSVLGRRHLFHLVSYLDQLPEAV